MINYNTIRLKEEQIMYNRIFEELQAENILQMMDLGKIENQELINYRKLMNGILLRVTPDLTPDLDKLFENVIGRLNYTKQIECYVANDPNTNAYNFSLDFLNQPNVIVLTSQLINTYDDNEIEFAIGHEIGHLIIDEKKLGLVRNFIFSNAEKEDVREKYLSITNEIQYLDNLIELSADRFGFIGCKKLDAAISTLFKMYSGINIRKKFSFSQLFEDSEKKLSNNLTAISENMLENSSASTSFLNNDHPIYPIRILSVKYFSHSKLLTKLEENEMIEDKNLEANIGKLCGKLQDFENVNAFLPYFIASSGLIIAELDGEITMDEIDAIKNLLAKYTLFPSNVIDDVYKSEDKGKIFEDSAKTIFEENPEIKEGMFVTMINFALADSVLHKKEKEYLFEVGESLFNFSKEQIAYNLAFSFKEMYLKDKN
jgi:hypothetical protein